MIAVAVSGPLFEGTLDVRRGQRLGLERATETAAEIARGLLRARTRYSTPKYGHAAQSVRSTLTRVGGDQFLGKVFIGGQAAFLAPWLEFGTRQHSIPTATPNKRRKTRTRIQTHRASGGLRRALVTSTNALLSIPSGGGVVFRTYRLDKPFRHRGTRAYRWAAQTQAQINRLAPEIFERAMAEALKP